MGPLPPSGTRSRAPIHTGGALERGVDEAALYIADEDHRTVRRVPLPLDERTPASSIELPGAPAQVLPLSGRVLVTVRDPGLLLVLTPDAGGVLHESGRVALPADAWGIAIDADESLAVVTSAWTHQVSAIDLASLSPLWTVDVAREPRAVVVREDGKALYVTHLVGASFTRLDGAGAEGLRARPTVTSVLLPPAPLRSPSGVTLDASLAYAALLDPEGSKLYVARHALGALGDNAWFGASTVDVLSTVDDQPLAPRRHDLLPFLRVDKAPTGAELIVPGKPLSPFTQPRALAFRRSTRTLLVASEGDDLIAELDASGVDPTRGVLVTYPVGSVDRGGIPVATRGGAPTGLALSEDEHTLFVWCRSTYDLASVTLADFSADAGPAADAPAPAVTHFPIADDALSADAALGRKLFYSASDRVSSGGVGCAGCHPDGRDDGHVWHEGKFNTKDGTQLNFVGESAQIPVEEGVKGAPRRTPMLAGMVDAVGPYGWHAESPDLDARLRVGFGLHRWGGMPKLGPNEVEVRAAALVRFLRVGLVAPPKQAHELDATQRRGRELFTSNEIGCATCHVPESGYTARAAYSLAKMPLRPGFDDEDAGAFKTPSLRFVGGRAPYFHDGRAPSLQWIIDNNTDDRMGKTQQLSGVDRASLVAFLKTL